MKPQRSLFRQIGIASLVVLFLAFASTPSVPSVPASVPAPDPQEVELLEELQSWLFDGYGQAASSFGDDLAHALRDRPQSFELFRRMPSAETSAAFLSGLPYGREIERAAEHNRVDPLLVAAVVAAESSFDATARSPKGALGLMQVTPETADHFGIDDLLAPAQNLEAGARYLQWLLRQFDGDLELSLAAYNAGPGNVRRYGGVPPFPETRRYVEKVLSLYVSSCRELWIAEGSDRLLDVG